MKTIQFPSLDGLTITADFYPVDRPEEYLLLCHRSHFNRGEYKETAIRLNTMGYTCLAIDQRSGMNVLGVVNETSSLAKKKGMKTGYLDARQDIEAAIDYLFELNHRQPIVLVGSSYSATLGLLIAAENDKVKAVAGFSPSECLKATDVAGSIRHLKKSVYVTSANNEIEATENLLRFVKRKYVTQFKPAVKGSHGSRVLWESSEGHEVYWKSFQRFLSKL